MPKILITTVPFGDKNPLPVKRLEEERIEYLINPIGRKLKEEELAELISDFDVVVAGTEPITDRVMGAASRLRLISRVGIGLDSVDLLAARRRGIDVSYTPDAPAPAVAELTIGLMLSLLRHVHVANAELHLGKWHRYFGRRISEVTIGVIGVGRIGGKVLNFLMSLGARRILVNDVKPHHVGIAGPGIQWADKETIYREADIISLHVPLTAYTKNMISADQLALMKPDALIVNTARGGIVNETDLARALREARLGGAAIDVFDHEPYDGELGQIDRCLLTAHMGSMSVDCRSRMEIEATEEAIRFIKSMPLQGLVPEDEYEVQRQSL